MINYTFRNEVGMEIKKTFDHKIESWRFKNPITRKLLNVPKGYKLKAIVNDGITEKDVKAK